jgi:pyruvate dehydrogenase E1 component alpha subunit
MTLEAERAVSVEVAAAYFAEMSLIRRFEQAAYRGYEQGDVHGTVHVSIGQEAVAVGVVGALRPEDTVLSHHRGHAHALAKGVDPNRLMAELCGRVDGVSRGKGGSMHATDIEHGFLGTMAIVGSAIPLATGVALAHKRRGRGDVCVAFFGDGAINQGVLYESMNLAELWALPVVYVCENNAFAITTAYSDSTAGPGLVARAQSFGLAAESVDGQDILAVREAAARMIAAAREGRPAVLEALTYRFMGHSRGDPAHGVYRTKDELNDWKQRDPIDLIARAGGLDADLTSELDNDARRRADQALDFARDSAMPGPEELTRGVAR